MRPASGTRSRCSSISNSRFNHALSGRPGPVWLEIPLDVQASDVDAAHLRHAVLPVGAKRAANARASASDVANILRRSTRQLIVPGNGVRLGHAEELLEKLVDRTGFPVAVPCTAKDLIAEDDPHGVGVFGTAGQRRANFAVQNADALLVLGAGLNVQKCGFNVAGFAPKATKIIVDIDERQLYGQALKPDVAILADVQDFLPELIALLERDPARPSGPWLDACREWKRRYPLMTPEYRDETGFVNSYLFVDALSDAVRASDTLVTGNGLDVVSIYQAFRVRRGQRVLISGWGSMGWDLPLSVGACIGSGQRTIVVAGRRQHPVEHSGTANDRSRAASHQDFRLQQSGLLEHLRNPNEFFRGPVRRSPPALGRQQSRLRQTRFSVRP